MRRRTLLVALAGLAVVVAAGAVLWPPRSGRITRENFDLLQVGMSKPEVYALLGPPGVYLTRDVDYGSGGEETLGMAPRAGGEKGVEKWAADEVGLWVKFDADGHVSGAVCIPMTTHDHGLIGNVLWRIKYQLFRWFPGK